MKARLEQIRLRIDELSLRERALVFLTGVALIFMAWQSFMMGPLEAQQKARVERINAMQKEVATLDAQMQALVVQRTADPDAENRRALEQLQAEMAKLDGQIQGTVAGVIEPKQMARMLEEVLSRSSGLKLKKARSLAAKPLVAPEQGSSGTVYQHGLRLELEGSYLDALAYLRALQRLPRPIYWDELHVTMESYPKARITITVHTLSLSEGWIGV